MKKKKKCKTKGSWRLSKFYHSEKLHTTSILDSGLHKTVFFVFHLIDEERQFSENIWLYSILFRSVYAMSNNLSNNGA